MTADRPTGTGPVPAPESTHTPGPVFRDRGVIIATLTARIAELETERDQAKAEVADLHAALTELAPADEVLVEGSYFPRADLPRVLGNFMRASADYAREAKEGHRRAEAAEAETAALRARIQALADDETRHLIRWIDDSHLVVERARRDALGHACHLLDPCP